MAGLVDRRDIDASQYGDTFHYPVTSAGTAVTYAAGYRLSDNLQVDTDSTVDLSIDQFKYHPFHIPWNVKDQVKYDTMSLNMRQAGESIARAIDSKVHAVILAGATLTRQNDPAATAQTGNLALEHITGAFTAMNVADVPTSDRAWVFHPTAYNELLNLSSSYFVSHDFVDNSPLVSGHIGTMLGAPVHMSTNVGTDTDGSPAETNYANLYFHKDCAALAMQRDIEVEQAYDIETQGWFGNARAGYGAVMLRGDHACVIATVND